MIEIMSPRSSKTALRSAGVRLDMPHWTIRFVPARTARIIGGQSSACMCRIAAPACSQRAASSAIASAVAGYGTSGWSQQMFGVAVMISGGRSSMKGLVAWEVRQQMLGEERAAAGGDAVGVAAPYFDRGR